MPEFSPVEVVPTGHAKIVHKFTVTGGSAGKSISFGVAIPADDIAGLLAAAGAAHTSFEQEMIGAISDEWTLVSTEGRGSPVDGGFVVETGTPEVGTVTDPPLLSNSALLVEKSTSMAGRGKRGRMFIPGALAEGQVDASGNIDGAVLPGLVAAVEAWRVALVTHVAIDQVVLFHSDFIRDPAVAYDPDLVDQAMIANPDANNPSGVTAFLVDPVAATQRRRMR